MKDCLSRSLQNDVPTTLAVIEAVVAKDYGALSMDCCHWTMMAWPLQLHWWPGRRFQRRRKRVSWVAQNHSVHSTACRYQRLWPASSRRPQLATHPREQYPLAPRNSEARTRSRHRYRYRHHCPQFRLQHSHFRFHRLCTSAL